MKRLITLAVFGTVLATSAAAQDAKRAEYKEPPRLPGVGDSWVWPPQNPGEGTTFDEKGRLVISMNGETITLELGHGARLCGDIAIWQGDARQQTTGSSVYLLVQGIPATACPIERK